jgi:hypothetical protein
MRKQTQSGCRLLGSAVIGMLFLLPGTGLRAQGPTAQTTASATLQQPPLPATSETRSPVGLFRKLLAMSPAERQAFLASRPESSRDRIVEKLREYTSLPADERELRLRATELRWYLTPALTASPTNTAALLERVPEDLRPLVETRIQQWMLLPPPLRQQFLDDDEAMRLYARLDASTPAQQQVILDTVPASRRSSVEAGYVRWRAKSEAERQASLSRITRFFDLTEREKKKVLATFSESERSQMQQTLAAYEKLPPAKRLACLKSFGKFASLSPEERREFLKNAEKWQAMSPTERDQWRKLVRLANSLPPLPQGRPKSAPSLPPSPLDHRTPLVTNSGQGGAGGSANRASAPF